MPVYNRKLTKGILWFYKFNIQKTMYRSKAIYPTKQEAKEAEAEAYQEALYRAKHPDQPEEFNIKQAIDERLDYIKVRKSKSYYTDTKRYLSILYHKFTYVSEVTKFDIEGILSENVHRGSYVTNAILRAFKALFNFTIQNHSLDIKNPCQYVKPFSVDKKMKYIPSDIEIKTLLSDCDENQRRLLEFIRDTGARLSEALNLKGEDITERDVTLYTRKSVNSNLVPRRVAKPACLVGLTFGDDEKVFGYWTEQPKFLDRKLKKLSLHRWGFHSLRHRYASILSAENVPIYEISQRLGHQSITTTQIYLQLLPRFTGDISVTSIRENTEYHRRYRI